MRETLLNKAQGKSRILKRCSRAEDYSFSRSSEPEQLVKSVCLAGIIGR